ncbi:uncharacterized protein LOC129950670 [Eupeodes corollae]|uniref:uncharacterized protein LOC129950670 n=1 Tax=Eupeodes corollae TaxID=290404 RepID=UPI0024926D8D|nr:uncharacterized protein LOC129950670 [Eupeodes corollae]
MNSLARLINGKVKEEAPIQCLEAMNRLWTQVEEIHHSIWEAVNDPGSEGYNRELYTELETSVLKNQASLSKTLSSEPSKQLADRPAIQLPKMSIPKFDGDYLKWQTFSGIFTKMIHEQPLPPIQKMWYLKTNVSGDAERLMRHLELTEDNYSIAWNILQDSLSNKRAQTSAIIQRILSLPNMNPEMKAIREFHDAIHKCLKSQNSWH